MSRILTNKNKKDDFINNIIKGELLKVNKPTSLKNYFTKVVNDLGNKYEKEIVAEEKFFKNTRKNKSVKPFLDSPDQVLYPKGKIRKFDYTTVPNQSTNSAQEAEIKKVYSPVYTDPNQDKFN